MGANLAPPLHTQNNLSEKALALKSNRHRTKWPKRVGGYMRGASQKVKTAKLKSLRRAPRCVGLFTEALIYCSIAAMTPYPLQALPVERLRCHRWLRAGVADPVDLAFPAFLTLYGT